MAVDALRREAQPNQAGPVANVAVEQNQAQVARAQIPPAQGEAPPQGIAVRPNMGKHTKQLIIYSIQLAGAVVMGAAGVAGVAMGL